MPEDKMVDIDEHLSAEHLYKHAKQFILRFPSGLESEAVLSAKFLFPTTCMMRMGHMTPHEQHVSAHTAWSAISAYVTSLHPQAVKHMRTLVSSLCYVFVRRHAKCVSSECQVFCMVECTANLGYLMHVDHMYDILLRLSDLPGHNRLDKFMCCCAPMFYSWSYAGRLISRCIARNQNGLLEILIKTHYVSATRDDPHMCHTRFLDTLARKLVEGENKTLLCIAAQSGNGYACSVLMQYRTCRNSADDNDWDTDAMMHAIKARHQDIVELLVSRCYAHKFM